MTKRAPIIGLLLILLLSVACNSTSTTPLRVAHNNWPGYEPLVLAESELLYGDVEVINYRVGSATETIQAFEHDIVDVAAVTLDEALLLQNRHAEPLVIIAVMDISHGADAIVAKQGINTIVDLKGKRVGVESTALGGFFLSRALDATAQLEMKDIKVIPITHNRHQNAFVENEVDAVVTFEPVKTALTKLGGNVIFDSSMIPNEIVDVLITTQSRAAHRDKELQALVKGYFGALRRIQEQPVKMQSKMAGFQGISMEEFKKSQSGLVIPDEKMNHLLLGGEEPQLQATIEKLKIYMASKMMISEEIGKWPVVSDQFIPVVSHVK